MWAYKPYFFFPKCWLIILPTFIYYSPGFLSNSDKLGTITSMG